MTKEIQRAIKREEYETYKSARSALLELVQELIVKEECKKMIKKKTEKGKEDGKRCEHNKRFYKFGIQEVKGHSERQPSPS